MSNTIRLIKLREADQPLHPNNIPVGDIQVGQFVKEPTVGECFWLGNYWRTSTVQEIIDEYTFRTHNSIYKYEFI